MLTCREVTQLVGTEDLRVAPLRTRLSAWMHLAMCRHCRRYTQELKAIGDAVRRNGRAVFGAMPADGDRILAAVAQAMSRDPRTSAD